MSPKSANSSPTPSNHPAGADYKQGSGIGGNLNSIGSDTLNNVMTMWAEQFRKI